eukprot:gene10218-11959_t
MIGTDYMERVNAAAAAQQALQANSNIDSLLHVHRRKLQRRAANRKSAQLSRARKKAHLEELKGENLRLQQLVDVLDSQPELVFCVTTRGNITYISERTVNFLNVTNTDSENDDDPTHITQILSPESADSVLKTIEEIEKISPARSVLAESSMIFSSKNVEFKDAFGNPLVGTLRCARVIRRPVVEELMEEDASETPTASAQLPPAKKSKTSKALVEATAATLVAAPLAVNVPSNGLSAFQPGVSNSRQLEEWSLANLSSLRMLTECVSNMADDTDKKRQRDSGSNNQQEDEETKQESYFKQVNAASSAGSSSKNALGPSSSTSGSVAGDAGIPEVELENEFVCVIRTSDSCFARYSTRSDLYMFVSTPLSTASMEAHDMRTGNSIVRHPTLAGNNQRAANGNSERQSNGGGHKRRKSKSPPSQSGSRSGGSNNGSNNSLGDSASHLPKSESSLDKRDNTSLETNSDDSHTGESSFM